MRSALCTEMYRHYNGKKDEKSKIKAHYAKVTYLTLTHQMVNYRMYKGESIEFDSTLKLTWVIGPCTILSFLALIRNGKKVGVYV